jgi:two-component system response regulator YesN
MTKKRKMCEEIIMQILECDRTILIELNCKTLSNIYGLNRSYLSRIFKEYQGIYLGESIKLIKLLRCAFFMAENRDLTVKEISDLFGYCRVDYFIKSFKKIFGMTPGKFIRCT